MKTYAMLIDWKILFHDENVLIPAKWDKLQKMTQYDDFM